MEKDVEVILHTKHDYQTLDNLNRAERPAFSDLQSDFSIIILSVDKRWGFGYS